jgi:hypothetical protein
VDASCVPVRVVDSGEVRACLFESVGAQRPRIDRRPSWLTSDEVDAVRAAVAGLELTRFDGPDDCVLIGGEGSRHWNLRGSQLGSGGARGPPPWSGRTDTRRRAPPAGRWGGVADRVPPVVIGQSRDGPGQDRRRIPLGGDGTDQVRHRPGRLQERGALRRHGGEGTGAGALRGPGTRPVRERRRCAPPRLRGRRCR